MAEKAGKELKNQVVVITGASSGFGRGCALEFAKRGANLVLAARRSTLLDELAHECESLGCKAIAVPTDVTDRSDMEALAHRAVSTFLQVDVWLNAAGIGALGRFDQVPLEDHVRVIEITLIGVLQGSYYAMKQFRQQGRGTLINIASLLGKVPGAFYGSYTAAKHGVVGLSGVLREELRKDNINDIHVCTVMPGAFDTPFFEHAANYTGHDVARAEPPFHDPQEVVQVIVKLATDPEDEVAVGSDSKRAIVTERFMPRMAERQMQRDAKKMEESPSAASTTGSLYEPVMAGAGVVADGAGA
jgi:short-subunit dehydrogenase